MHNAIPQHRQSGFSLVEVLVALVIMSVGMLGIAGLYVQSLQAGRTSMFRHNAIILASDVADRIRANRQAGIAYEDADGSNNGCATGFECNEVEMALNDIFLWKEQADATLPRGDVTVVFDDTVEPWLYTITVSWDEPQEDDPLTYAMTIPVMGN